MTDEELDALVAAAMDRSIERLRKMAAYAGRPSWETVLCEELSAPITALRAQLAEARTELVRRVDMHECAMAERDDATLYSDEQKARADEAEAKLAKATEVLREIEKRASETNRLGAVTGGHWTRLTIACLTARAALADLEKPND